MREFNANDYNYTTDDGTGVFMTNNDYRVFVSSDIEDIVKMCRENTQFNKEMQEELLELARDITSNAIILHTDDNKQVEEDNDDILCDRYEFLQKLQFYSCVTKSIEAVYETIIDKMVCTEKLDNLLADDMSTWDLSNEDMLLYTDTDIYFALNDDYGQEDLCEAFLNTVNQDNVIIFCQMLIDKGFPTEFPKVEV